MFLGFFTKYGKLILEILIVAAIIFILVFINPGNIFGGGLKLQNTAINVTAIKEIGQLITAEYYGETIATYDQSVLKLIEEEDISDEANDIFRDMKQYLLDEHLIVTKENDSVIQPEKEEKKGLFAKIFSLFSKKPKGKFKTKLKKQDKDSLPLFYDNPLSPEIMGFYFDEKPPKSTNDNAYRNLLWSLLQEIKAKSLELNQDAFAEYMRLNLPVKEGKVFSDFHYEIKRKKKGIKKELKTNLAMIGRGWVKAGIDFGELNDQNFIYDKENGIVHIYGVYAKILAKDINPWFIPEKKIPGFQILESKNANFRHAKVVKQYCIDKLEKMAKEAGILKQAERQAKETIKNFIGLLTDSEVKEVHFHNDIITQITSEIYKDKYVNYQEAEILDSLIPKEIEEITAINVLQEEWLTQQKNKELREVRLKNIINELKACYYYKRPIHYNRFSYLTTSITEDGILTDEEILKIEKQRWPISKILTEDLNDIRTFAHHAWYGDSILNFISEYNTMLDKIKSLTEVVGDQVIDTLIPYDQSLDSLETKGGTSILVDSLEQGIQYKIIKNTSLLDEISKLKYPIHIPSKWKTEFAKKKNYFDRKTLKEDTATIVVKELFDKINKYNTAENLINCDTLQVIKQESGNWIIDSNTCNINNEDRKLVIEYILNYYLQESEGFSGFSKASAKYKKAFKTKKIGEKVSNFSDWFSGKFGG